MTTVKIPFYTNSEHRQALLDPIAKAADKMGLSHHDGVLFVSYFLEFLADGVAQGKCISIPGFGLFAPMTGHGSYKATVRFKPSRAFRQQVAESVTTVDEETRRRWHQFRRSHAPSTRPDKTQERTFTTMRSLRHHIRKQLAGCTRDVDDRD